MIECETVVKKWGNSLGIVIPSDVAEMEHIKEKEKIRFMIIRDSKALTKTFGIAKGKLNAQEIKDQLRKELYND